MRVEKGNQGKGKSAPFSARPVAWAYVTQAAYRMAGVT